MFCIMQQDGKFLENNSLPMFSSLFSRKRTRMVANVAEVCGLAKKEFGMICKQVNIINESKELYTS